MSGAEADYIIAGAGLSGSILARKLAQEKQKKVLLLERRNHIAGNAYDYTDEHGIKVQKYGPHVFHTNDEKAYAFFGKFCDTVPYRTKCEAVIDGISTPAPFNFSTIDQFYEPDTAAQLKRLLLMRYADRERVTVVELLNDPEPLVKAFAEFLFEKDYRPYTAKQWNLQPSEIDPAVLKRVPIVLSYQDNVFDDTYELMPRKGFERFFANLLDHPNITVRLGEDALEHISVEPDNRTILYDGEIANIIYTGAIDELFDYRFGILPYRSLWFRFVSLETENFQNAAIVVYPQEIGFTRITEYTKMPFQQGKGWTSIAYEYPVSYNKSEKVGAEPYYPVLTEQSQQLYAQYSAFAQQFQSLTLCGRLADFKYYNMDQAILRALAVFDTME